MAKLITTILEEINDGKSKLEDFKSNFTVRTLLEHAFDVRKKLELPEGSPSFRPESSPSGMSPTNLYQIIKKLYIFTRKDLAPLRREQLFIQILESIHHSEADILIAVKDQIFESIYPNITGKLMVEEGIVDQKFLRKEPRGKKESISVEDTIVDEPDKSGRHLSLDITDSVISAEKFDEPPVVDVAKVEESIDEPDKSGRHLSLDITDSVISAEKFGEVPVDEVAKVEESIENPVVVPTKKQRGRSSKK